MNPVARPIREPQQKRSIELKQKILQTALTIFSEKGYYHASSTDICRAAGISVGSFYSYFKDKKQLLINVMEYYHEMFDSKVNEDIDFNEKNKDEFIKKLIGNLLETHKIYSGFQKELSALHILDPEIGKHYEQMEMTVTDSYYSGLMRGKDFIRAKNLRAASVVIYKSVDSIIHEIVNKNLWGEKEEALISELSDMLSKYLFK